MPHSCSRVVEHPQRDRLSPCSFPCAAGWSAAVVASALDPTGQYTKACIYSLPEVSSRFSHRYTVGCASPTSRPSVVWLTNWPIRRQTARISRR